MALPKADRITCALAPPARVLPSRSTHSVVPEAELESLGVRLHFVSIDAHKTTIRQFLPEHGQASVLVKITARRNHVGRKVLAFEGWKESVRPRDNSGDAQPGASQNAAANLLRGVARWVRLHVTGLR